MKAKVIETGEIVNVLPYPIIYQEKGQGPNRREWDEDELEFIYSNKNEEKFDLENEIILWTNAIPEIRYDDVKRIAEYFYELGLKSQKGE